MTSKSAFIFIKSKFFTTLAGLLDSPQKCFELSRFILFASVLAQYLFFINELNYFLLSDELIYKALFFSFLVSIVCAILRIHSAFFILAGGVIHVYFSMRNPFTFVGWAAILPFIFLVHFIYEFYKHEVKINSQYIYYYIGTLLSLTSIIYFNANFLRLSEPSWINGLMVENILTNTFYSRVFYLLDAARFKSLFKFLCYLTLIIECVGAFLVFLPLIFRRMLIFLLIGLHLSILFLTKVQIWSPIMISLLILGLCKLPWDDFRKNVKTHVFLRTTLIYLLFLSFCLTTRPPSSNVVNMWLEKTRLFGFRGARIFPSKTKASRTRIIIYGFDQNDSKSLYDSKNYYIDDPALLENSALSQTIARRLASKSELNPSEALDCSFYQNLFQNSSSFVIVNKFKDKKINLTMEIRRCAISHNFEFQNMDYLFD